MRAFSLIAASLLLSACASVQPIEPRIAPASVSFSGAAEQRVELSNFDYTPREVRLQAGRPYALVLANVASAGHDFAAPEFFAAAQVSASHAPLIAAGKVDVPAGESRTIHLVPHAGTYDLVCTHTGHALLGMRGRIVVE
jgi:uncharacterized cupredoxin-like copper-binding protein